MGRKRSRSTSSSRSSNPDYSPKEPNIRTVPVKKIKRENNSVGAVTTTTTSKLRRTKNSTKRPSRQMKIKKEIKNAKLNWLTCRHCKRKKFDRLARLMQHENRCQKQCQLFEKIVEQLKQKQLRIAARVCFTCRQAFINSSHLRRHNRKIHGDPYFEEKLRIESKVAFRNNRMERRSYPCRYCGKNCHRKDRIEVHERLCINKQNNASKSNTCTLCKKTYSTLGHLKRHETTFHSNMPPSICQTCGKSFHDSDALKSHQCRHTDIKPLSCKFCNMKFYKSNDKKKHERTHTGVKPYKCQHCPKLFARSDSCNAHEKTHLRVVPFKCDKCDKSYTQSNYLALHMRTHTGHKSFKCNDCDKDFFSKASLKKHMTTHTETISQKCLECNDSFIRKDRLVKHMQKEHGITFNENDCDNADNNQCKKALETNNILNVDDSASMMHRTDDITAEEDTNQQDMDSCTSESDSNHSSLDRLRKDGALLRSGKADKLSVNRADVLRHDIGNLSNQSSYDNFDVPTEVLIDYSDVSNVSPDVEDEECIACVNERNPMVKFKVLQYITSIAKELKMDGKLRKDLPLSSDDTGDEGDADAENTENASTMKNSILCSTDDLNVEELQEETEIENRGESYAEKETSESEGEYSETNELGETEILEDDSETYEDCNETTKNDEVCGNSDEYHAKNEDCTENNEDSSENDEDRLENYKDCCVSDEGSYKSNKYNENEKDFVANQKICCEPNEECDQIRDCGDISQVCAQNDADCSDNIEDYNENVDHCNELEEKYQHFENGQENGDDCGEKEDNNDENSIDFCKDCYKMDENCSENAEMRENVVFNETCIENEESGKNDHEYSQNYKVCSENEESGKSDNEYSQNYEVCSDNEESCKNDNECNQNYKVCSDNEESGKYDKEYGKSYEVCFENENSCSNEKNGDSGVNEGPLGKIVHKYNYQSDCQEKDSSDVIENMDFCSTDTDSISCKNNNNRSDKVEEVNDNHEKTFEDVNNIDEKFEIITNESEESSVSKILVDLKESHDGTIKVFREDAEDTKEKNETDFLEKVAVDLGGVEIQDNLFKDYQKNIVGVKQKMIASAGKMASTDISENHNTTSKRAKKRMSLVSCRYCTMECQTESLETHELKCSDKLIFTGSIKDGQSETNSAKATKRHKIAKPATSNESSKKCNASKVSKSKSVASNRNTETKSNSKNAGESEHIKQSNSTHAAAQPTPQNLGSGNICQYCRFRVQKKKRLKPHENRCLKLKRRFEELEKHPEIVRNCLGDKKTFHCHFCMNDCKSRQRFQQHWRLCQQRKSRIYQVQQGIGTDAEYSCQYCRCLFREENSLVRHEIECKEWEKRYEVIMESPAIEPEFKCCHCNKIFDRVFVWQRHEKQCALPKPRRVFKTKKYYRERAARLLAEKASAELSSAKHSATEPLSTKQSVTEPLPAKRSSKKTLTSTKMVSSKTSSKQLSTKNSHKRSRKQKMSTKHLSTKPVSHKQLRTKKLSPEQLFTKASAEQSSAKLSTKLLSVTCSSAKQSSTKHAFTKPLSAEQSAVKLSSIKQSPVKLKQSCVGKVLPNQATVCRFCNSVLNCENRRQVHENNCPNNLCAPQTSPSSTRSLQRLSMDLEFDFTPPDLNSPQPQLRSTQQKQSTTNNVNSVSSSLKMKLTESNKETPCKRVKQHRKPRSLGFKGQSSNCKHGSPKLTPRSSPLKKTVHSPKKSSLQLKSLQLKRKSLHQQTSSLLTKRNSFRCRYCNEYCHNIEKLIVHERKCLFITDYSEMPSQLRNHFGFF